MKEEIPDIQTSVEEGRTPERIYTERQVLQEEAIAHMPPLASLLLEKQYDLSSTLKVVIGVSIVLALYFGIGADAVITGFVSFLIFAAFGYLVQLRHIEKDKTYFFESRKAGQIIDPSNPGVPQYPHKFQVGFDRTAMWSVPNGLIRKGIFNVPGEPLSPLPGSNTWIFVDLFDEKNGTVVLPRSADVANISMETNMNRTLAMSFDIAFDKQTELQKMERDILDKWERKAVSTRVAQERLKVIRNQQRRFFVERDVFFSLQQQVPMLQDVLRLTRNSIIVLANSMVAETVYELIHVPMPANIKQNINMVRKKMRAPMVGQYSIDDLIGGG